MRYTTILILTVILGLVTGCSTQQPADSAGGVDESTPTLPTPITPRPQPPGTKAPAIKPVGLPDALALPDGPTSTPPEIKPGPAPKGKPEPPPAAKK